MKPEKIILGLVLVVMLSGCSRLMGTLRRDLDDTEAYAPAPGPTVGGRWTERGYLAEEEQIPSADRYAYVGHTERAIASQYAPGREGSWASGDENARDALRNMGGVPAYSNMPSLAPPVKRMYKNGARATKSDFVDEEQDTGSLWAADGQTNFFFSKNKVRGIGDIVTVNVEQELYRDVTIEVRRTLTPKEKLEEIKLAQDRLSKEGDAPAGAPAGKDAIKTTAAAPKKSAAGAKGEEKQEERAEEKEKKEVRKAVEADIDVTKSLMFKSGETMLAEIVERYNNGNYKIRASKRIPYQNGFKTFSMVAIVRGADISEEDILNSGKLYEYRLEVIY
ncbi:MAG: hypothetical protein A2583_02670 [Bdellovibrionales bacterium RIFOXYD1_FULL_53_11]|nr:MAG: hypothetical protein A2583_02670 [Bdellovibrionales bacterium RIFOXYD1_FULL_53_11]